MVPIATVTCGLFALLVSVGPALAFGTQSVFTDLKPSDCTIVSSNDFETVWACPGYRGIPVMLREAQLHFYVSFGLKSTEERAAKQTPPRSNSLGPQIEWRLSNRDGAWKPFAAIVHFLLDAQDGKPAGEVLGVTRIAEGATCQIAYVDEAEADAVALAEAAADAHGFDFDCKDEPVRLGTFKAW